MLQFTNPFACKSIHPSFGEDIVFLRPVLLLSSMVASVGFGTPFPLYEGLLDFQKLGSRFPNVFQNGNRCLTLVRRIAMQRIMSRNCAKVA